MRVFAGLTALLLAEMATATPLKRAPLITRDAEVVEGKYIVMMKTGASISAATQLKSAVDSVAAEPDVIYKKVGGFSATLTAKELDDLRNDPNVAYIEQDSRAKIFATQQNAPWGLARLSNKEAGSTTYTYDDSAGEGVCAYIVDTGIEADHPEFEGRAEFIATYIDDIQEDDHGHGTHCAGTVGSKTYGVAKKSNLYGIKIFDKDGYGTDSLMIAGMDRVLQDVPSRDCPNGVVINMSFGNTRSQAVNDAAKALVNAGYFAVVAAGNGDLFGNPEDAAGSSPASEPTVCTVGATTINDNVASFSNYGSLVDIYAPGVNVKSTWIGGSTNSISGTSMATPHIVGLGAYFLALGQPASGLCEYLQGISLEGIIDGVPQGTKNLLAQNDQAA
ncbi:Cuticle-degrading protease [Neonectria ditissima]|uniref:Cuticle-degrading protease n=1 Tax=Neonectria ditissima TaxID=78410 RepID=A0A0P7AU76_9HYPO|nr:Cuticle-degrading protease [Neonectria ditissima]